MHNPLRPNLDWIFEKKKVVCNTINRRWIVWQWINCLLIIWLLLETSSYPPCLAASWLAECWQKKTFLIHSEHYDAVINKSCERLTRNKSEYRLSLCRPQGYGQSQSQSHLQVSYRCAIETALACPQLLLVCKHLCNLSQPRLDLFMLFLT